MWDIALICEQGIKSSEILLAWELKDQAITLN